MSLARRATRLRGRLAGLVADQRAVFLGTVGGACAFLLGFAVTYLSERHWTQDPTRPILSHFSFGIDSGQEVNVGPDGALPSAWRFAAWQYHRLHGVGFDPRFEFAGNVAPPSRPLVIVPALVLAVAGFLLVARTRADSRREALGSGGLVAVGYFPPAALTARLSAWTAPDTVRVVVSGVGANTYPLGTVGLPLPPAIVLTGVVVPVAFGSLGGYLAYVRAEHEVPLATLSRGGLHGALAFAGGWAITRVGGSSDIDPTEPAVEADGYVPNGEYTGIAPGGVQPDPNALTTWQYHRHHGAAMDVRYLTRVTDGVDELTVAGFDGPVVLVPVVVIALAGAALVYRAGANDLTTAAVRGAAVAVGYLPLAVASALLSAWTPPEAPNLVITVEFLDAVQRTGLLYPVVFGAIGGLLMAVAQTTVGPDADGARRDRGERLDANGVRTESLDANGERSDP